MKLVANILGYQAVWFAAVYGAGRGATWPAVLAAAVFAVWQLARSTQRALEIRLIGVALVLGMLLDGALAFTGLLHYSASSPAVPPGGAPVWILALWVAFALTLNQSLRWLRARPLVAVIFGALGGPLAYAAAARVAGAVTFAAPAWQPLACLAAGWGAAVLLLGHGAGSWQRARRVVPTQSPRGLS